jgi:hypothetical protein
MGPPLIEGKHYYIEDGKLVFTERYHLERGYCCNSRCRHCPYREPASDPGVLTINAELTPFDPKKPIGG